MATNEITITCTATSETIYTGPEWGATDALVNYYCDNGTPSEIYDACCDLGDAIARGEYAGDLMAYLACSIEGADC